MFTSCSGGFFPGLKCNEADETAIHRPLPEKASSSTTGGWTPAGIPATAGRQVGTWEVDRERVSPQGLRAISDHAHAKGIKLIVWFEPERVAAGHLALREPPRVAARRRRRPKLLNLGNPEARQWLTDHVDQLITEQGIDLYRQDFNIDPLAYWRANDAPDRQGITEIRHVEGYLAYWDELRRRHPGHAHRLLRLRRAPQRPGDDAPGRAAVAERLPIVPGRPELRAGNQGHTYGLSSSGFRTSAPATYYNDEQLFYNVRSHMGPAFGFCADVRREGIDWAKFRRVADQWRAIAPCYLGDFYPLTPYSLAEDVWIAWQFDRPDLGEGMVQVFRRQESIYESARLHLCGLQPDARYTLTNLDAPGEVRNDRPPTRPGRTAGDCR